MEETKNINLRDIPVDLLAKVSTFATQERRTRNAQMLVLIEEAVNARDQIMESIAFEIKEMRREIRESIERSGGYEQGNSGPGWVRRPSQRDNAGAATTTGFPDSAA